MAALRQAATRLVQRAVVGVEQRRPLTLLSPRLIHTQQVRIYRSPIRNLYTPLILSRPYVDLYTLCMYVCITLDLVRLTPSNKFFSSSHGQASEAATKPGSHWSLQLARAFSYAAVDNISEPLLFISVQSGQVHCWICLFSASLYGPSLDYNLDIPFIVHAQH